MLTESWSLVFWENIRGSRPVEEWLLSLPAKDRKRLDRLLTLLQKRGPLLPMPYSKNLGDGLFELRDTAKGPGFRVYYGLVENQLVLLFAAGNKSSQKRDIETSKKRLEGEEN